MKKATEIKEQLGEKLLALYERAPFGTVPKKEIDLLVFDALARDLFQSKCMGWWSLGPAEVRELSLRLKVSESRIEALVEQVALHQSVADVERAELLNKIRGLALETRQDKKDIADGKIRLYVSNRLLRSAIEGLLLGGGGMPETSFNRGQLVIRLGDLLIAYANGGGEDFLERIADKARESSNAEDVKKIEAALNKKSLRERATDIGGILLNRALGKGADEALGAVFKLLSKELKERL